MSECWYCGVELIPFPKCERPLDSPEHVRYQVIDHMTPRCRGGKDSKANRAAACFRCNSKKGRLTVYEFREYLYRKSAAGKALERLVAVIESDILPADLRHPLLRAAAYIEATHPRRRFAGEGGAA